MEVSVTWSIAKIRASRPALSRKSLAALTNEPDTDARWDNEPMHNAATMERLKREFSNHHPVTTTLTQHIAVASSVRFMSRMVPTIVTARKVL